MKRTTVAIIFALAVFVAAQSALAHHSAAMFDNTKVKELKKAKKLAAESFLQPATV